VFLLRSKKKLCAQNILGHNVKDDISEKTSFADRMPQKTAELHEMLKKWLKEVDAQMPTPNPDYNPQ